MKLKIQKKENMNYNIGDELSMAFYYSAGNKSTEQLVDVVDVDKDLLTIVPKTKAFMTFAEGSNKTVIVDQEDSEEIEVEIESIESDENLLQSAIFFGSANTTPLPQTEFDIPYRGDFVLGVGYDAITGNACKAAVDKFDVSPSQNFTAQENSISIQTEDEYKNFINAHLKGSATIKNVEVSGSMEFTRDVKVSNTTMSIVSSYEYLTNGYDEIDESKIKLSSEAKKYLEVNGADKFRRRYGDYFVSGFKRGSIFNVVYSYSTNKETELTKFKADISAKIPKMMEASIGAEINDSATKNNVRTEIKVYMSGCKSAYNVKGDWNSQKIAAALSWFKENLQPAPIFAQIKHYCVVDNDIDCALDIDPDLYKQQASLYNQFWILRAKHNTLKSYYHNKYENNISSLKLGLMSSQYQMLEDKKSMEKYQKQTAELYANFKTIEELQRIYYLIKEEQNREPGSGNANNDYNGFGEKTFGYKNIYVDGNDIVKNVNRNISKSYTLFKHKGGNFEFNNSGQTIVAFSIRSVWNDGTNGHWRKECDKVLLQHRADIRVESELSRGLNWTITYYYVDNEYMRFE